MSSIHDVARYCGVSTATVSRALRGLPNVSPVTRELVQSAAAELGYVPSPSASGLSGGRNRAIAIVIPSMGRWFYTEVVEGVDSVLRAEDYDAFLVNLAIGPQQRLRQFSSSLLRKRADAVIALGSDFSPQERHELRTLSLPTVVVGGPVRGVKSIGLDDRRATTLALDHLLDLGHRRIAHIGGEREYGMDYTVALLRHQQWLRAITERGVRPADWWFASGGFTMPEARSAALRMLERDDRPTAIFAGSDEMAFGVLLAAAEVGLRIPDDLSVVGIDDHAWSASFGLTTVRQDPHDQGARAAKMVIDDLAGVGGEDDVQDVQSELVVRRTTAPPPPG